MKTQIWLLPYQRELVVDCLKFVSARLNEGTVLSEARKMAGRYTHKRIWEVIKIFEPLPKKEQQP